MTGKPCWRSKSRFETHNAPTGALGFSQFYGPLFSCTRVARCPGFPRQRSAQFLSTCRRPMVKA